LFKRLLDGAQCLPDAILACGGKTNAITTPLLWPWRHAKNWCLIRWAKRQPGLLLAYEIPIVLLDLADIAPRHLRGRISAGIAGGERRLLDQSFSYFVTAQTPKILRGR